jgi:hypothetical protein
MAWNTKSSGSPQYKRRSFYIKLIPTRVRAGISFIKTLRS